MDSAPAWQKVPHSLCQPRILRSISSQSPVCPEDAGYGKTGGWSLPPKLTTPGGLLPNRGGVRLLRSTTGNWELFKTTSIPATPQTPSLLVIDLSTYRFVGIYTAERAANMSNMLTSNRLKQVLSEGTRPAMGFWQMLPGANLSRVLARAGADWVMVDCEHGNIDDAAMHEAVPAIAALGVSPIVRLPDLHPWMVKRALDTGAHGILVPLIRTAEEVKAVVAAAKFPPEGQRGFGSPFVLQNFGPGLSMTDYLQQANEGLLTMVQVETQEALESVEEIAPLVDVVFVGPFDLGNNIGHPIIGGKMDPELDEAITRILKATVAAGKKCGIYCSSGEEARGCAEKGFHMISVATDYPTLWAAMAGTLAIARGEAKGAKGGSN